MPAAETTGGRPSAKVLQILFWAGVGLAPLAALLLLFGGGFVLQLAAVLAVGVVVLIGLSIALRPDNDNVRSEIEEAMFEELDTLRDDIRGDITHAARATHGQLVERIGVLHETVDALRNQVDMMRGQLERATRAAQQAAAQHAGPQPVGSAAVPQGVLRHTETVQVTTKTMVVDPTDQRRDGTVYGARPVEIPQQRRPVAERVAERDADWPQRPGEWSDRDGQDWHDPAERGRHDGGRDAGRVVDGGHWSEAPDRAGRAGRAGWADRDDEPDQAERDRGGRSGSHDRGRGGRDAPDWVDQSDRTGRGDWTDRGDDGDTGRADRGRGDWTDRGDAGGHAARGEWADGDRADRGARGGRADADPGRGDRGTRGEWGARGDGADGEGGGRRRRAEWTDRGDGARGDDRAERGRGEHSGRGDWGDRGEHGADRGERSRGTTPTAADVVSTLTAGAGTSSPTAPSGAGAPSASAGPSAPNDPNGRNAANGPSGSNAPKHPVRHPVRRPARNRGPSSCCGSGWRGPPATGRPGRSNARVGAAARTTRTTTPAA